LLNNKKLICRRDEATPLSMSLEILVSHSRSFEITPLIGKGRCNTTMSLQTKYWHQRRITRSCAYRI